MKKNKEPYMIEIKPGLYVVKGTGHTKGVLNYDKLVNKIRNPLQKKSKRKRHED